MMSTMAQQTSEHGLIVRPWLLDDRTSQSYPNLRQMPFHQFLTSEWLLGLL